MDIKDKLQPHLKSVKPYVPGKPIEELRREKQFEGEIVKLASNENPYPPIDEVMQAIQRELSNINRYPNSGCFYLTRELAEYLGVDHDQIFVGNGSNEIIDLFVRVFAKSDEEIIYPFPSFIIYPIVAQLAGVKAFEVPLKDYRLDLEAIKQRVTLKTKIIFICNPNNPTGTYVTKDEVERFLEDLRPDIFVLFDEAYFEYVTAHDFPDTLKLLKERPNIVVLRTFSKIHSLSGLRVGYSISHKDTVTCLHKVRQPFNVNRIAQAASRAALEHFDKIAVRKEENELQKKHIRQELLGLGFTVPPSQTNFLLVIPPRENGNIINKLMEMGIIVRGMKPFGLGEESFRVTIGTPNENKKFIDAIKELLKPV